MIDIYETVLNTSAIGVPWFPQKYGEEFYVIKGLLGVVATLMLIIHMNLTWRHVVQFGTLGQQLRYLTLLGVSVLFVGASVEQVKEHALVNYRNFGGMVVCLMLIFTMAVSIREDVHRRRNGE